MKRLVALCIEVLLLLPGITLASQREESAALRIGTIERADDGPDGAYVVVLRDELRSTRVDSTSRELLGRFGASPRAIYQHALRGFACSLDESHALEISRDPRVEYVAEVGYGTVAGTQLSPPWGLDRIDQQSLPLDGSFTYNGTGAGVTVYVIDSGIDKNHTEFEDRVTRLVDFVDDDQDATTDEANDDDDPGTLDGDDSIGHGTHVAGTIGGKSFGVAKGVSLVGLRAFGPKPSGISQADLLKLRVDDVLSAIDWVVGNGTLPAVVNMSLGFSVSRPIDEAVKACVDAGFVVVAAAGNKGKKRNGSLPLASPRS